MNELHKNFHSIQINITPHTLCRTGQTEYGLPPGYYGTVR